MLEITRRSVSSHPCPKPAGISDRSDVETMLILTEGFIMLEIAGQLKKLVAPIALYLNKDLHYQIHPGAANQADIWDIKFHRDFYPHFFFDISALFGAPKTVSFGASSCFYHLAHLCEMLAYEVDQQQNKQQVALLRNLFGSILSIFLSFQNDEASMKLSSTKDKLYYITKFLQLLNEHYKKQLTVDSYADQLHIGSRQLNNMAKNLLGKSISQLITLRKIVAAKSELISTDKQISEIGFDLGYPEKAYFSRVFKQVVGCTPSAYKLRVHPVSAE